MSPGHTKRKKNSDTSWGFRVGCLVFAHLHADGLSR